VELVNFAVIGRGIPDSSRVPEKLYAKEALKPIDLNRKAYFGRDHGWVETPILGRADLQKKYNGPVIIEEYDATCLIPPKAKARLDSFGNIVIDL
jgi:N-methylhydantoinase A